MPMDKLAKYMCTDAENCTVDELESNLLCFKHKMMNLVWTKGTSGLEGEFQAESEVRNRWGSFGRGDQGISSLYYLYCVQHVTHK